ncbi:hypothetical protein B9R42_27840 [Arthrospira platensis PCC 7345]
MADREPEYGLLNPPLQGYLTHPTHGIFGKAIAIESIGKAIATESFGEGDRDREFWEGDRVGECWGRR